jgi:hypothetical protein
VNVTFSDTRLYRGDDRLIAGGRVGSTGTNALPDIQDHSTGRDLQSVPYRTKTTYLPNMMPFLVEIATCNRGGWPYDSVKPEKMPDLVGLV